LANDEWLIKKGIFAFMRKQKLGDAEPPSQEEIASIKKINIPCTHLFLSIVKAVVELVKNMIEFVVLSYIPLVPSLNK
jgi:hypothetical protein